jgi:hypothetical protein
MLVSLVIKTIPYRNKIRFLFKIWRLPMPISVQPPRWIPRISSDHLAYRNLLRSYSYSIRWLQWDYSLGEKVKVSYITNNVANTKLMAAQGITRRQTYDMNFQCMCWTTFYIPEAILTSAFSFCMLAWVSVEFTACNIHNTASLIDIKVHWNTNSYVHIA